MMGNKLQARILARQCGVPVLPGSEKVHSYEEAVAQAHRIGFPIMMKAAAGGGGRGMKIVTDPNDMRAMFTSASAEARAAFGDDTLYVERYIANARHIEVQLLGDRFGNVIHLGERDCSLQRRHQKVVEEAPAPAIPEERRQELHAAAVKLARNIGYENAGTVEFIFDQDAGTFYFLEMNTRIQVEHPVSEMITGIDLVQEQLRVARGEALRFTQSDVVIRGHAIECRITAEVSDDRLSPESGPDHRLGSAGRPEHPARYPLLRGLHGPDLLRFPAGQADRLRDLAERGGGTDAASARPVFGVGRRHHPAFPALCHERAGVRGRQGQYEPGRKADLADEGRLTIGPGPRVIPVGHLDPSIVMA